VGNGGSGGTRRGTASTPIYKTNDYRMEMEMRGLGPRTIFSPKSIYERRIRLLKSIIHKRE
jgi:hypothetical protein